MSQLPPGPWDSYKRPNCRFDVHAQNGCMIASDMHSAVAELLIRAEREADQTLADVHWLNSLERVGGGKLSMITVMLIGDDLHLVARGPSQDGIDGLNDFVSQTPATRGAVRKLAAALGVTLKERSDL